LILGNLFKKYDKYKNKILTEYESEKRINVLHNPFNKFFINDELETIFKAKPAIRFYKKFRYDCCMNQNIDEHFKEKFK
jgi:hypothetical protein